MKYYDLEKPTSFVITGDIDAMWLRDSTNQVIPYVQYINQDENLKLLIKGLINRQSFYINIDSYGNAFNQGPSGSPHVTDSTTYVNKKGKRVQAMRTPLGLYVFERKFEIDSLGNRRILIFPAHERSPHRLVFYHTTLRSQAPS